MNIKHLQTRLLTTRYPGSKGDLESDDDLAIKSALGDAAPSSYDNLTRQSRHIERIGDDLWLGTARYAAPQQSSPPPQTGESVFSFDTGGGSHHITQSLSTIGRYPADAPDHQGAIGVTSDAVEGVEITVPVYHFSETHYIPASQVTQAYCGDLFQLTGKVNSASFRGLAAGECLFLEAVTHFDEYCRCKGYGKEALPQ